MSSGQVIGRSAVDQTTKIGHKQRVLQVRQGTNRADFGIDQVQQVNHIRIVFVVVWTFSPWDPRDRSVAPKAGHPVAEPAWSCGGGWNVAQAGRRR
jgi:hypothetical protein